MKLSGPMLKQGVAMEMCIMNTPRAEERGGTKSSGGAHPSCHTEARKSIWLQHKDLVQGIREGSWKILGMMGFDPLTENLNLTIMEVEDRMCSVPLKEWIIVRRRSRRESWGLSQGHREVPIVS